jgi:hypothetical protein
MAAHFPPSKRADVQRVYGDMLRQHPQLMKQLGVPSNDVACAVATFLAGSYMAFHEIDFPDQFFKPLYEQMRSTIASDRRFAEAGLAERRELYEELVIIGTYLAVTHEALRQRPDPKISADMKAAAKDYLQQFLKVDANRVRLGEQGMTLE